MLPEGTRLGRYVIKRRLGSGGMGAVYEGIDTSRNRTVAVKVIHPHIAEIEQFIKRFHQEALLLEKLAHPRVVRIYEHGESDGHHFIAMEFITGASLTDVMRGRLLETAGSAPEAPPDVVAGRIRPLPESAVVRILEQMARVLQEAYEIGVIHRDIKPDNVIVTDMERWDIKLLDFGIAKDTAELHTMVSQTGQILGTPAYMSPEQCEGKPLDTRSDLYSLGVTAYQLLTGHLPFQGPNTMAYMKQHLMDAPPPPRSLNPDVSPGMEAVVMKMLAKDALMRYQTPQDLLEDLIRHKRGEAPRAALERAGTPAAAPTAPYPAAQGQTFATYGASQPTRTAPVPPHPGAPTPAYPPTRPAAAYPQARSKAPLYLLLALLLVGVGGLGTYLALRSGAPARPEKSGDGGERPGPPPGPVDGRGPLLVAFRKALRDGDLYAAEEIVDRLRTREDAPEALLERLTSTVKVCRLLREIADLRGGAWKPREEWARRLLIGAAGKEDPKKFLSYLETVTEGERLLAAGDLDGAERRFREATTSGYGGTAAMARDGLARVREARERATRQDWGARLEKARKAYEKAYRLLEERRFKEAAGTAEAALEALDGLDVPLARRVETLKKEIARRAGAARRTERMRRLVEKADGLRAAGRYREAAAAYRRALEMDTSDEGAKDGADFCERAAAAVEAFGRGRWKEAADAAGDALARAGDRRMKKILFAAAVRSGQWYRFSVTSRRVHAGRTVAGALPSGLIVSASVDKNLVLHDGTGAKLQTLRLDAPVRSLITCGDTVVLGASDGGLAAYRLDGKSLKPLWKSKGHRLWVRSLAVAGDGSLYSGGSDGRVVRRRLATGEKISERRILRAGWVNALLPLPDGRIAAACSDHAIHILTADLSEEVLRRKGHSGAVLALKLAPDVRVTADDTFRGEFVERTGTLTKLRTGLGTVEIDNDKIKSVLYSVFSSGTDGRILKDGRTFCKAPKAPFRALAGLDGLLVATRADVFVLLPAAGENTVKPLRTFRLPAKGVSIAVDPDGLRAVVGCDDGSISVWGLGDR